MYLRRSNTTRSITWFLIALMPFSSIAEPWICNADLDGDGQMTGIGETSDCLATSVINQFHCPIQATACVQNSTTSEYECPTNPNLDCVTVGSASSVPQCSPNICHDLALQPAVNEDAIDPEAYLDNGPRSEDGQCLGQMMIFAGRAMECLPSGSSTGYNNCCENDTGEILGDSTGSSTEMYLAGEAITTTVVATYEAVSAAYEAYNQGQTAAASSQAAGSAFTNTFAAVDPTTLVIMVVLMLLIDYFMQACDSESMETALHNESGRCIRLGEYCRREIFGDCTQEGRVFCCFSSKLARIMHEQGRPQLATINSFGSPTSPECRGFFPEEFQSLDFSAIDFSEYYEDVAGNTTEEERSQIVQDAADNFIIVTQGEG